MDRRVGLAGIAFAVLASITLTATLAMIAQRGDGGPIDAIAAPPAQAPAPTPFPRPDEIVVRARTRGALDAVAAYATSLGYTVLSRAASPPSLLVAVPGGVTLARAVGDFTAKPGILYAEPAYGFRAALVPADPLYGERQSPYLGTMSAPAAWDLTRGAGVVVAVLDTGVDIGHPDLQGRIAANSRESANGVDDDGNGCVDDVYGCAFVPSPNAGCAPAEHGAVADDAGHGTFVSGIIAAAANDQGISGVAPDALILPVKILDCTGNGNTFSLGIGIVYAATRGARVINISLGGPIDSAFVREAIRVARVEYGALVVAATGSSGAADVAYPARYDEVLAVGATRADGASRAPFSNAGPSVDIVAIGERIIGTVPDVACEGRFNCLEGAGGYAIGDGTSFAAPIVSGAAALVIARFPFLPPDAVAALLRSTADPVPPSDVPDWAGGGRLNMLRAVQLPYRLGGPGASRN